MEIIKLSAQPTYEAPDRALARQIVAPNNSRAQTHSVAEITIPVGVAVEPHRHREIEEVYHIVAGTGRMLLEAEQADLGPGDTVVIRPLERHAITNTGTEPLRMLVSCVPAWNPEDQIFD